MFKFSSFFCFNPNFKNSFLSTYNKIHDDFIIGCWRVSTSINRNTNERVSTWSIDQDIFEKNCPSEEEKQKYISEWNKSVSNARRFHHPNILKIVDYKTLNLKNLNFVTENIKFCLKSEIGKLEKIDGIYFGWQLANALNFLHENGNLIHLNVSSQNIFVTKNMKVKLFGFNLMHEVNENGSIEPIVNYQNGPGFPHIRYVAPEVVSGKEITKKADVYSFGTVFYELVTGKRLVEYTKVEEYNLKESPFAQVKGLTSTLFVFLKKLLDFNVDSRSPMKEIINDEIFNRKELKSLEFIDTIIFENPKERFDFYKQLGKQINLFSKNMKKTIIIPLLIKECKECTKFAPILIGIIFEASKTLTIEEFTEKVFPEINFLVKINEPPEILFAFLHGIDFLFMNISEQKQVEYILPILNLGFKSKNKLYYNEILKKLTDNSFIKNINNEIINKTILPNILKICTKTDDLSTISKSLESITNCLSKVDHDKFLKFILPTLYDVWMKNSEPYLIPFYSDLLLKLNGSEEMKLEYGFPVAAEIISNIKCDPYYQKQLSSWMLSIVTKYKIVNKLDDVEDPKQQEVNVSNDEIIKLFDPLAQELNINPKQTFDFNNIDSLMSTHI